MTRQLNEGLYDLLITEPLRKQLSQQAAHVDESELSRELASERVAEELGKQIARMLSALPGDDGSRFAQQLELANGLIAHLRQQLGPEVGNEVLESIATPAHILRGISRHGALPKTPEIGLATPWLFTAGKGTPSLLHELRHEMAACDQMDILVSFITVSGVRKISDVLKSITAVGADGKPRTKLRVITTTYIGATEVLALNELARLTGCEVRISLDGRRTRLHAKAWIFHRKTGFGSAYVGSANLSGAALMGGLEWTVKFTERGQGELYQRAIANFETLWADAEFQAYDPDNLAHVAALEQALNRERRGPTARADDIPVIGNQSFFDIQPKTYQLEMLEQLCAEREHGRMRNLVVAATGTGKTVVAAFDYRENSRASGSSLPRLLFVAHRREILQQAQRVYREVLRDHSFGELLFDGAQPQSYDHIFTTIDSLSSRKLLDEFGTDYWHTVVIDECHRMAADRFDAFANAVRPKILLGLTATPERADGESIHRYFDCRADGSPSVELRLWHALEMQLLAPFEYYGCDDDTDFSEVPWGQAGERDAISIHVASNLARARLVINEWRRLTGNPRQSKAIVFCVDVKHARFMTEQFNKAGIPAACIVGETDAQERRAAPGKLERGEISALVTVDLYNEGVDLPAVDTLLLLRPTESPVVFQQQLGRGLRLAEGKDSCLVLDFVGQHRAEFRFDRLFSGITGLSKRELVESVENGFAALPPGCHIQLQQRTRNQVLSNLRALLQQNWRRLRSELLAFCALRGRNNVRLIEFLHEQSLDAAEIYRESKPGGWTALRRAAGFLQSIAGPEEDYLTQRFGSLLHVDDPVQIELLREVGQGSLRPVTPEIALRLQMLAYQVDGQASRVGSYAEFLERLAQHADVLQELHELAELLDARSTVRSQRIAGIEDLPLCLHASYGVREILTAAGYLTGEKRPRFGEGLLVLKERKTELLFVTLDKRDGYHEGIAYHDYAISADRFHWQTQNRAGPDTPTGRRYLESAENGWQYQLFVRTDKASPYKACGPVVLEEASGDRPMNITWCLTTPLPARFFQEFSVLRSA